MVSKVPMQVPLVPQRSDGEALELRVSEEDGDTTILVHSLLLRPCSYITTPRTTKGV